MDFVGKLLIVTSSLKIKTSFVRFLLNWMVAGLRMGWCQHIDTYLKFLEEKFIEKKKGNWYLSSDRRGYLLFAPHLHTSKWVLSPQQNNSLKQLQGHKGLPGFFDQKVKLIFSYQLYCGCFLVLLNGVKCEMTTSWTFLILHWCWSLSLLWL